MSDLYELVAPVTTYPVTLAEAREFLRVPSTVTADDSLINLLIESATKFGENETNRVFIDREFIAKFSMIEISRFEAYPFIQIRRSPLVSLDSVKTTIDGSLVDVNSDNYDLKETSSFARVLFTDSLSCDDIPYPLQMEITVGYGAAASVPEDIKTAIKTHINFMYENRGDAIADGGIGMPLESKLIYRSGYRILNTYG